MTNQTGTVILAFATGISNRVVEGWRSGDAAHIEESSCDSAHAFVTSRRQHIGDRMGHAGGSQSTASRMRLWHEGSGGDELSGRPDIAEPGLVVLALSWLPTPRWRCEHPGRESAPGARRERPRELSLHPPARPAVASGLNLTPPLPTGAARETRGGARSLAPSHGRRAPWRCWHGAANLAPEAPGWARG